MNGIDIIAIVLGFIFAIAMGFMLGIDYACERVNKRIKDDHVNASWYDL